MDFDLEGCGKKICICPDLITGWEYIHNWQKELVFLFQSAIKRMSYSSKDGSDVWFQFSSQFETIHQGLGAPVVLFYCLTRPGFYAAVQLLMFPPFSSFKRAKTPWTAVKGESNGSFLSTVPSFARLHQGALSSNSIEYIPAWLMEPWSRLSFNIF